jgi:hypothetical protein
MPVPRTIGCPINGCDRRRLPQQVMCKKHWWAVPPELRKRIWRLYQTDRGSAEHLAAIREAIDLVSVGHSPTPPAAA